MVDSSQYLVNESDSLQTALEKLNNLSNVTLFAISLDGKVVGALSDGDIRRALVKGVTVHDTIEKVINRNFIFLQKGRYSVIDIENIRQRKIKLIPLVDDRQKLIKLIDLEQQRTVLPVDAVIMAGGEGRRLRPLTEATPKPLLHVGDKPIIERNIERLHYFGIDRCVITVKYLGEKIMDHFGDGRDRGMDISYIRETDLALGTIGAVSLIDSFEHDFVLVMNSDLLTNIDFENFFSEFEQHDAAMSVATIPYHVTIPYAVLETKEHLILGLKEKPTYTYHSNAGIYLFKREVFQSIPKGKFYNATDLMDHLIASGQKVTTFPLYCYWLDIGSPEDFKKAQDDIKHIKF
jgi:dTDP-glucose pyrophosphorylase